MPANDQCGKKLILAGDEGSGRVTMLCDLQSGHSGDRHERTLRNLKGDEIRISWSVWQTE